MRQSVKIFTHKCLFAIITLSKICAFYKLLFYTLCNIYVFLLYLVRSNIFFNCSFPWLGV